MGDFWFWTSFLIFFQFWKRDVLQTLKCTVTFWRPPPSKGVVMIWIYIKYRCIDLLEIFTLREVSESTADKNISRVFRMIWHCKTFFAPQVPLHGRLFAPLGRHWRNRWVTSVEIQQPLRQWMHYAFPRHCGSPRDFWRVILFIFQFGRILSHFDIQISWFGIHLV